MTNRKRRGKYRRGTLAMPNAWSNTNGSRFFICLGELKLPHHCTNVGEVIDGMEAVDAIAALPADSQDRPRQEAVISKVSVQAASRLPGLRALRPLGPKAQRRQAVFSR